MQKDLRIATVIVLKIYWNFESFYGDYLVNDLRYSVDICPL